MCTEYARGKLQFIEKKLANGLFFFVGCQPNLNASDKLICHSAVTRADPQAVDRKV